MQIRLRAIMYALSNYSYKFRHTITNKERQKECAKHREKPLRKVLSEHHATKLLLQWIANAGESLCRRTMKVKFRERRPGECCRGFPGRAVDFISVCPHAIETLRLTIGMAQQRARWPMAEQTALKLSASVTASGAGSC